MQPRIIKKDKLYITGLSGDGTQTGEVWNVFDSQYNKKPFPKADENGYEIRYYKGEKPVANGKDIHVGFNAETADSINGYTTVAIPAAEYAVFEVCVAKGYDSGNAEMDEWLAAHSTEYKQLMLDGVLFIVECYNEKFKGGDKPDSIVEMWIPIYKI